MSVNRPVLDAEALEAVFRDDRFQEAALHDFTILVDSGKVSPVSFLPMITPRPIESDSGDHRIPRVDTWSKQVKGAYTQPELKLNSITRDGLLGAGGLMRYLFACT